MSENAARREMLRVVLRETLNRHGIPVSWIAGETLVATSRGRAPGVHWRLVIKHWEPRLLTHGIALQHSLIKRVTTFDPMAGNWLMGISWQFALEDDSLCPPMPHPGIWTAEPHAPHTPPAVAAPGGSGDVIAGPVRIGKAAPAAVAVAAAAAAAAAEPGGTAKADLERLLAVRDADFRQHGGDDGDPSATEPMDLKTQPMPL